MKWIAAFLLSVLFIIPKAQANHGIFASIDSLLRSYYNDMLPGASVAILLNNQPVFERGYGLQNLSSKEKNTPVTNFNIASLTKQLTALAILQLAEQNKLSLTDAISRFFPDMNKKVADVVTVQQLLSHTSGLLDHYGFVKDTTLTHAHNIDVYNAIKAVDSLYFTPGTQFRYSNTGYCLLGLIIEKLGGLSYSAYMEKNIFGKAGMLHTTVWSEKATIEREATGYDFDSATHQFIRSGPDEHVFFSTEGDGGIFTSVHDYLLWLMALHEGTLVRKESLDKARKIQFAIQPSNKLGYCFGWFVDESGTHKKVYHSGDNGGFRTYSFTIPSIGLAIVIFSNRSDIPVEDIAEKVYHILYPVEKPFVKIEVMTL